MCVASLFTSWLQRASDGKSEHFKARAGAMHQYLRPLDSRFSIPLSHTPSQFLVLTNPMWQSADNWRHTERECSRDMRVNRNESKDRWWREKREEGAWLRIPYNGRWCHSCITIFFFGQIFFLIKEENISWIMCSACKRTDRFSFGTFFGTLIIHWRTSCVWIKLENRQKFSKFGNNVPGID